MLDVSCGNKSVVHENELVVGTHFHMNRSFCINTSLDTRKRQLGNGCYGIVL